MDPTEEVGGDYYDIINSHEMDWIIIGDVSGHGVPAGLIMMMVQSAIRTQIMDNPTIKPSELIKVVNRSIQYNINNMDEDKFMTINSPSNGDSTGPYMYLVDVGGAATNFRRTDGTTLSYDGDLQPWNVVTYYTFDTNSNTTQYPHLSVMDRWTNP